MENKSNTQAVHDDYPESIRQQRPRCLKWQSEHPESWNSFGSLHFLALSAFIRADPRQEKPSTFRLFQKLRHIPKLRMLRIHHQLEQHHLDIAQMNAGAFHATKTDVPVEPAARRGGVGDQVHAVVIPKQSSGSLPDTYMGFDAAQQYLLAFRGLDSLSDRGVAHATEARLGARRKPGQRFLEFVDGGPQLVGQLFGPDNRNIKLTTGSNQHALRMDHGVAFVHQACQPTLDIDDYEHSVVEHGMFGRRNIHLCSSSLNGQPHASSPGCFIRSSV